MWWNLLRELVEEEEQSNQTVLHHAVASMLLQHSTTLPTWLVNSYKVNLLNLFYSFMADISLVETLSL